MAKRDNGSELIQLQRQIGGKLQHRAEVAELNKLLVDTLKVMQGLAGEFRKVVDDMNADFEALKAEVAELKAKSA
jgi:hypothetical protein